MTNKMLIYIIVAIVVVCGAVAGYAYWQQTKPLVVSDDQIKSAQENQQAAQTSPDLNKQQPAQPASASSTIDTIPPVAKDPNVCQRNFDANKLKTDKVSISGHQVEIDVKGFGKITLELYDKDAPKAVESFLRLVNSGYYNCLTFHRVAKGFVIQGGDPSGNGSGGESAFGTPFADELNSASASYKAGYVKGVLAMANSGPNTNGSQFFIMLADNQLPHAYTIFGKTVSGLDVVDKIGQVDIIPQMGPTDGAPKQPVVMESVKIIK